MKPDEFAESKFSAPKEGEEDHSSKGTHERNGKGLKLFSPCFLFKRVFCLDRLPETPPAELQVLDRLEGQSIGLLQHV